MSEKICLYNTARTAVDQSFVKTGIARIEEMIGVDRQSEKSAVKLIYHSAMGNYGKRFFIEL